MSGAAATALDERSWAFALKIYSEPGVAEACLRLQDKAGVDVMLLLMVAFAGGRGIALSPSDIREMAEACRPWREQIVQRLRALRVALKSGPLPAPDVATEKLRGQIKAGELHAERLQNDFMAAWLQQRDFALRDLKPDEIRATLREVVVAFHGPDGTDDVKPEIAIIAAAAQRIAT